MDVPSGFTIPVFRSPSVVDSITSGTCLAKCCLALDIHVTIYFFFISQFVIHNRGMSIIVLWYSNLLANCFGCYVLTRRYLVTYLNNESSPASEYRSVRFELQIANVTIFILLFTYVRCEVSTENKCAKISCDRPCQCWTKNQCFRDLLGLHHQGRMTTPEILVQANIMFVYCKGRLYRGVFLV
jgi:hypothetical protein